jgi:uncharacterized membrane protein (UPF0127 family)
MLNETPNKKIAKTKSAPKVILAFLMFLIGVGLVQFGILGIIEDKVYIKTSNMLIKAEVLDSDGERTLGLSGRNSFDANKAVLFVFDSPDTHGIWMKDMKFAIDIVWLDSNKKVVTIEPKVQPGSYPKVFKPKSKSLYVIEFAEGRSEYLGIKVGQTLSW